MSHSDDTVVPEGLWFLRRLTTKHLQLVAQTMKLPTSISTEELRQLIDGTLADMDHDPANVQVVIQEATRSELCLLLVDDSGVFQKCGPVLNSCRVAEQGEALQNLQEQLEDALQQNMELKNNYRKNRDVLRIYTSLGNMRRSEQQQYNGNLKQKSREQTKRRET